MSRILAAVPLVWLLPAALLAQTDVASMIAEARTAAPPSITDDATYMDWEHNVLREGSNEWTCMPSPPGFRDTPMCLDETWMKWAQAWMTKSELKIDRVGTAYMMAGDAGASNTDPFATAPTADNEWVVSGPHLMVIVPDTAELDALPTDPENGGPWVMWKGTPYAHIMMPIGDQPTRPRAGGDGGSGGD